MAVQRVLQLIAGVLQMVVPNTSSAGSGDAGKLVALNASGLVDSTMIAPLATFVASGASHAAGGVPDPGSSAGTTKFLREDATFAVPSATVAAPVALTTSAVGVVPLSITAIASQTADAFQIIPTSGTKQVSVNAAGTMTFGTAPAVVMDFGAGQTQVTSFGAFTTAKPLISTNIVATASFATAQTTKSADFAASVSADHTIFVNATGASRTITLPSAATFSAGSNGYEYVIFKTDSSANTVTIATTSSQTISGRVGGTYASGTTLVLTAQGQCVTLQGNGSNWFVIASN